MEIRAYIDDYNYFSITNSLGQEVLTGTLNGTYNYINVSQLLTGVYFMRIWGATQHTTMKFLKE
jgi:hypothetical protein